jgi:hypothetical protein
MKRLLLICSICFCFGIKICRAQNTPFTTEQLTSFEKESRGLVNEYLHALQRLTRSPAEQRAIIIENVKSFFIPGSTIEVCNSKNRVWPYTLDEYLGKVVPAYANRFDHVLISFKQVVIDMSSLRKGKDKFGNSIYIGDFSYTQMTCFTYHKGLTPIDSDELTKIKYDFCDSTNKTGHFILALKYSPAEGDHWEVLLGNILAKTEQVLPEK